MLSRWIKRFIPEEPWQPRNRDRPSEAFWWTTLATFAMLAALIKLYMLFDSLERPINAIFGLISWAIVTILLALSRPIYCPSQLLAFYISALTVELFTADAPRPVTQNQIILRYCPIFFVCGSIIAMLLMQLQPIAPASGSISRVGKIPISGERTPEDSLRLWQFLSVYWVQSLMSIGRQRQLQKEDIWKLSYDVQSERLATAFDELRQSTVLRKLLAANTLDFYALISMSLLQLLLGMRHLMQNWT